MDINDRISSLLGLLTNGNQRLFARNTGLAISTLRDMIGPRKSDPSFSTLKKIVDTYPFISLNWLINEVGEPLLNQSSKKGNDLFLHGGEIEQLSKEDTGIHERVSLMIARLSLNPNSFGENLGYGRSQTVYDIINGKSAPSFDFFKRFLLSEYSDAINIDWLITGRGKMLIGEKAGK